MYILHIYDVWDMIRSHGDAYLAFTDKRGYQIAQIAHDWEQGCFTVLWSVSSRL